MKETGKDFVGQADALRDAHFTEPLREEVKTHPGLVTRKRVTMSGGTVWAMVTKTREQAAKEVQRVRDTFTTENLIAGAEILRGISRAFRPDQEQKTIYFPRDGYIAWIYAYVKRNALPPSR
jgi:hypothetical protein